MRIKVVLTAVLTLIALAVLVVLLRSPSTVAATNGIEPTTVLGIATHDGSACQAGETLPAGITAIRITLDAPIGPRVSVEALAGQRIVTEGTQGTAWYGSAVTVPVTPTRRAFAHVTVCFQLRFVGGYVALRGADSPRAVAATADGRSLPGRLGISYLRPARESWWTLAPTVMRHMGLGRAASGTWIALPIAALIATAIAVASWVLVRELG